MRLNYFHPLRDKQEGPPACYCDRCGEEIYLGEAYGEWDGMIICNDCIESEWDSLDWPEKIEKLGYDVKRAE